MKRRMNITAAPMRGEHVIRDSFNPVAQRLWDVVDNVRKVLQNKSTGKLRESVFELRDIVAYATSNINKHHSIGRGVL